MGVIKSGIETVKASGANFGDLMNLGFSYMDYKDSRKEGHSRGTSAIKAAGSFAWGEFYYGGVGHFVEKNLAKVGIKEGLAAGALNLTLPMLITMLPTVLDGMNAAGQWQTQQETAAFRTKGGFGSGHFSMTQAGYTMRQRSLNAIRSNGLNTQSALGNEARTYYRGSV